jgi:hypothetical protein
MPEPTQKKDRLKFAARVVLSGKSETLEVTINNEGEEAWVKPLLIEFKIPSELVAPSVREASVEAGKTSANMATLEKVAAAPAGWSVWAWSESNKHIAVVRFFNYVDQKTGNPTTSATKFDKDASLTLRIPLAPEAASAQLTIPYGYQAGKQQSTRIDGKLELAPAALADWTPEVSLFTDQESPTMLPPATEVIISWKIADGVSATLRGPLPGGNSELTLSKDPAANYRIDEGSLKIYAVGPATYILDAEVKGPKGEPNVQVIRTLLLDVFSAEKYANLVVRPTRVLSNGQVEIDWAVWGVDKALLEVSNRYSLELQLTEQDLSRSFHGAGALRVNALPSQRTEDVSLTITIAPKKTARSDAFIKSIQWGKADRPRVEGKPVALAVAGAHMALLTTDGLWTSRVGKDDFDQKTPLAKAATQSKSWHALTAFGSAFVVLRKTDGDELVLERHDTGGQPMKSALNLPGSMRTLAARPDATYQLAAFGDRVYVVVEGSTPNGRARHAFSARFEPDELRPEPRLEPLLRHRLLVFDNALYALHRGSGQMLRFDPTQSGELDRPLRAASAVEDGKSMIQSGLLVPLGVVLAVLDPAALPPPDPLGVFGLLNVGDFNLKNLKAPRKAGDIPQDLVYDPQHDRWDACGHGLDIQPGAVGAFRGGASSRLWVLQPDGELHTLPGATTELFARDYVDKFPSAPLPPALDAKLEAALVNLSGIDLAPVDEVCRAAGLDGFSATVLAEPTPLPDRMLNGSRTPFTLSYNGADPGTVKLRFMAVRAPGPRYLLELTFTGAGLMNVTSVFKRLSEDGRVADVPDTTRQLALTHGNNSIILSEVNRLLDRRKFFITNATTQDLGASPEVGAGRVEASESVALNFATPDFKISMLGMEKMGRLSVNLDFAMPVGVEVSSGAKPQTKLIRVNTDNANMLDVATRAVTNRLSVAAFNRYDGTLVRIPLPRDEEVYICDVGLKTMKELDGVRLGDGVTGRDGQAIYIPMAKPQESVNAQVMRVEGGSITYREAPADIRGKLFSLPNAVTVSDDKVYAMFGDNALYQSTRSLEGWSRTEIAGYDGISALAAAPNGRLFIVARKLEGFPERLPFYYLLVKQNDSESVQQIPLKKIGFPVDVPPLAVSPVSVLAAVGDQGGVLLAEYTTSQTMSVRFEGAGAPGHVVFSPDGRWIYCVHSSNSIGSNPRRLVAGRQVRVSRVHAFDQVKTNTITLPDTEGDFAITGNTRTSFPVNVKNKEQAALTLAVSPDSRTLFVSAGKTLMKIDTGSFTLQPWRATVETPCRLISVSKGWGNAWTLYALGSYYVGDGNTVDEYKTRLYAIPAPVN